MSDAAPTLDYAGGAAKGKPILRASGIHKTYAMGTEQLRVLSGASLTVAEGEFVAIMGASGSGKSTFLHILGALDTPERGQVLYEQTDVFAGGARLRNRLRNEAFGFVFQFYHLLPELNVLENVLMPAMVGSSVVHWLTRRHDARQRALGLIDEFKLAERVKHRPAQLSGGERQRVAIARALVNEPRVVLADEPTGDLDQATGSQILDLIDSVRADRGTALILVTHDPGSAARADRTLLVLDGRIANGN